MMERDSNFHHEGSISPSFPHIFSTIKSEPSDIWNPPSSNGLSENYTTYTPLETLHSELSYNQYMSTLSSVPSYGTFSPLCPSYANVPEESEAPGLHNSLYRNPDIFFARDEGIGSSPSSVNSASPSSVINDHLTPALSAATNGHHYYETQNERSSPGDSAYSEELQLPRLIVHPQHPQCVKCGVSGSDIWWRDSTGHFLCANCCHGRSLPSEQFPQHENSYEMVDRKRKRPSIINKKSNTSCTNCDGKTTSLWRRNMAAEVVCNACGLYEKLHKHARPLSMKKDTIQTRKRKPRGSGSRKKTSGSNSTSVIPKAERPATSTTAYTLPTYSTFTQLTRDSVSEVQQAHDSVMLPPISSTGSLYVNYRHDMGSPYHMIPSSVINMPLDPPRVSSTPP